MMPSSLSATKSLVYISPGPLLGSTLVIVLFCAMRHARRERRLSWTSTPLPPRGYRSLPTVSTFQPLVRVGVTTEQPSEGSSAFDDWVFDVTTRFHGKPWLLHRPGRPDVIVLSSPAAFEDIQRTFAMQFEKVDNEEGGLTRDVHGGAIALVNSKQVRPSVNTQRQLAASVLGSQALRQQASKLVEEHTKSLLKILDDAALKTSKEVELMTLMKMFSMEVFTELGFGLRLGALRSHCSDVSAFEKAVDNIQECVAERSKRLTVAWKLERLLDVGSEAALSRSIDVVDKVTLGAVDAKRKRRSGCDTPIVGARVDMVDLLLRQTCSSKRSKDSEFLAEFVLGLVVAARDSMAHTLRKCLQYLAEHPKEQEKLFNELKHAEKDGKGIDSVVCLEAVVKETLRLYPAKPFIRRRARVDTVLSDGTFVAAGTEVAMHIYGMARRENVWGLGSAQFRPQRWIDTTKGKLRPASSYKFNAFLGGPRACLGTDIAMTEIKTVVAAVLTKVYLDAVDTEVIEVKHGKVDMLTLGVPCEGTVRVQVRRRGPSPPGQYS